MARWVAAGVRPAGNSRGLSVPETLHYVLDHTGTARVLMAALSTAVTHPFGKHGTFYEVAGALARDLDGMRPPYEGLLLPPLDAEDAAHLTERLEARIGAGVAIVDINDRGGSVRAASSRALPPDVIYEVLRDNPLGRRDQSTLLGLSGPRGRLRPGTSPEGQWPGRIRRHRPRRRSANSPISGRRAIRSDAR